MTKKIIKFEDSHLKDHSLGVVVNVADVFALISPRDVAPDYDASYLLTVLQLRCHLYQIYWINSLSSLFAYIVSAVIPEEPKNYGHRVLLPIHICKTSQPIRTVFRTLDRRLMPNTAHNSIFINFIAQRIGD